MSGWPHASQRAMVAPSGDYKTIAGEIARLAKRDGLVLFVGAGINGTAGLMWKDLLQELLVRALSCSVEPVQSPAQIKSIVESLAGENDLYAQASLASVLLGPHRFLPILRSAIYSRFYGRPEPEAPTEAKCPSCGQSMKPKPGSGIPTPPDLNVLRKACRELAAAPGGVAAQAALGAQQDNFGYLCSIARLCKRPEIVAVVTYNYDTLLEHAMSWMAAKAKRQTEEKHWADRMPVPVSRQIEGGAGQYAAKAERLRIYHVHGCLPPPRSLTHLADFPVVLSQHDYARTMQDPYSWETACQLHFLRSHPCVFLGLSMTDWNMLRLLRSALDPRPEPSSGDRLFCIDVEAKAKAGESGGIKNCLKSKLLDSFGVRFIPAQAGKYEQLREFTDELFAQLPPREISEQRPNHAQ